MVQRPSCNLTADCVASSTTAGVTLGCVLQSVIAALPLLHARESFDYAAASSAHYLNERSAA